MTPARDWPAPAIRARVLTAAYVAALVALFEATRFFRFMTLASGFSNDHFLHLAAAQQMLFGDWPTRDFLDPGLPLMYGASALAQVIFGPTLYAEAVLVTTGFALAAVLTAMTVRALTGSRLLGLLAAVFEVLILPRAYGYPKLLMYAAGFLLLQRYVTRPTLGRLFAMAAMVVVAFLFRHDHGVNLGIAGVLAVILVAMRDGDPSPVRRALTFVGMAAALATPYLIYVQASGGLWSYLEVGLEFRRVELARQAFARPSLFGDRAHEAALFFGYWAMPILATVIVAVRRHRDDALTIAARVVPIGAVAVLVNWTFLRDPLTGRLQDAIVPVLTLGAWLVSIAWQPKYRWVWGPASAIAIVLTFRLVLQVGGLMDQIDRSPLSMPSSTWPVLYDRVVAMLRLPHHERVLPSRPAVALQPFYPYVTRCTTREQRLLVIGNAAELSFFSQRPFAGGQSVFVPGYYVDEYYQRLALDRLARQTVPLVVIAGKSYTGDYGKDFPILAQYIRERYVPLSTFGDPDTGAEVFYDSRLPVRGQDRETGWPCWM